MKMKMKMILFTEKVVDAPMALWDTSPTSRLSPALPERLNWARGVSVPERETLSNRLCLDGRTPRAFLYLVVKPKKTRAILIGDSIMGLHRFGAANPNWGGGRRQRDDGYISVYVGREHPLATAKGYAMEHRVLMSEHLGRYVTPEECVHHRDGDRANNVLDNLLLMNPSEHMRHHATGRTMSSETKQRLSQAKMGHSVSDETRLKISETKKADPRTVIVARENVRRSCAKLSVAKVRIIKRLLLDGHQHKSIAKRFGVARSTISLINSGTNWPEIEPSTQG